MASKWIPGFAACAFALAAAGAGAGQDAAKAPAQEGRKMASSALAAFPPLAPPEPTLAGAAFEQSAGGAALSAMAFATQDADWAIKWAASGRAMPKMRQARLVAPGERVQVLVFVASRPGAATIDEARDPLSYVIDIYRPDGTLQERLSGNACVRKGEKMEGGHLAVCEGALVFELEPGDPKGQWVFKVSLAAPGQDPLVFGTSFEAF